MTWNIDWYILRWEREYKDDRFLKINFSTISPTEKMINLLSKFSPLIV